MEELLWDMNSTQVYGYSIRLRWSLTHKKAKVSYTYGNDAPAGHLKTIQILMIQEQAYKFTLNEMFLLF